MVERGTGKAASTTARRADRADHTHGRLPGRAVLERARPEPVVLDLHAGRDRRSERLHPAEVPGDHEQLYRDAAVGRAHLPVLRHRDQRGWRKWTVQCGQWYAMYLAHGHTYEFYVTSIKGQGESTRSNIVRATLQVPGGATICSGTVASNYLVNPTGGRPGSGYRYEQRRDMKLETCLIYGPVTTGTTRQVTVRITWNTSGYPLNEGFFWYHLVDYTTGRVVAHQFYGTYDRGATSGSRQTTYTVDSSHYYWAYATGDGSIQLGPPGTLGRTSPFKGWYPPTGIDRLLAGTGYL